MAIHAHSTLMPAPQRASHPVDLATAAVLSRLPIPFAHRPCATSTDTRTADDLLGEIDREITRQMVKAGFVPALPTVAGSKLDVALRAIAARSRAGS